MVDMLAARGEHPTELPGMAAPSATRLWVFAAEAPSFLAPVSAMPDVPEAVLVRPAVGVELQGKMLRFGSMPQDVFTDFGPPEKVCVKDVDAVRIHSSRVPTSRTCPDYYYNYFHLGLDVLFDGRTHLVKKVILHTNLPTHERFSRYSRCFFQVPFELDQEGLAALAAGDALMAEPEAPLAMPQPRKLASGPPADGHSVPALQAKVVERSMLGHGSSEAQERKAASAGRESAGEADDADRGAGGSDDDREKGRKNKADRKAVPKKGKKANSRAPAGSPTFSQASDASPEPSPIVAKLRDSRRNKGSQGSAAASPEVTGTVDLEGLDGLGGFDELPPPALPLDSLDGAEECDFSGAVGSSAVPKVTPAVRQKPTIGRAQAVSAALQSAGGSGHGSQSFGGENAEPSEICLDVRWSWTEIEEVLHRIAGCDRSKPLVMNQSGHTPFGSTYFYAFPGLVFEVMQNGFLASLTVFSVPPEELPGVFQGATTRRGSER
ncbi:unnamed protein product [Polarella glacialis]|uniref:Uncharacterized protein n=1 Tax=Polarella glacialis TaxID=89957 RepID=A0A813IJT0_POLGL|nr:unnamed protein product [Polarella glacialis]